MKNAVKNRLRTPMFVSAAAVLGVTAALVFPAALCTTAFAAGSTRITEPSGTYHVVLDASGRPQPVTVVATGFAPGTNVFVEECDGRAPSEPRWSPSLDCDLGNAPAPAIADSTGTARFSKNDHNRQFVPVVGAGPSNLFNCIAPHSTPPANQLTSYTKCQIRVSTNNTAATDDQVFRAVVIGSGGSGGGSGTAVAAGVIVVLVVVGAVVGTVLWLRRRRPAAARRR